VFPVRNSGLERKKAVSASQHRCYPAQPRVLIGAFVSSSQIDALLARKQTTRFLATAILPPLAISLSNQSPHKDLSSQ